MLKYLLYYPTVILSIFWPAFIGVAFYVYPPDGDCKFCKDLNKKQTEILIEPECFIKQP